MTTKRIARSTHDRMIAGVAGGIAEYLNLDPTLVRLIFVLTMLPGGVPGLIIYLILAIIMPNGDISASKL